MLKAFSESKQIYLEMTCDVSNREDVEAFIKATGESFSKIDVLLNNAGKSIMSNFLTSQTNSGRNRLISNTLQLFMRFKLYFHL